MKSKPRHHKPKHSREDYALWILQTLNNHAALTSSELKPLRAASIAVLLGTLKGKP